MRGEADKWGAEKEMKNVEVARADELQAIRQAKLAAAEAGAGRVPIAGIVRDANRRIGNGSSATSGTGNPGIGQSTAQPLATAGEKEGGQNEAGLGKENGNGTANASTAALPVYQAKTGLMDVGKGVYEGVVAPAENKFTAIILRVLWERACRFRNASASAASASGTSASAASSSTAMSSSTTTSSDSLLKWDDTFAILLNFGTQNEVLHAFMKMLSPQQKKDPRMRNVIASLLTIEFLFSGAARYLFRSDGKTEGATTKSEATEIENQVAAEISTSNCGSFESESNRNSVAFVLRRCETDNLLLEKSSKIDIEDLIAFRKRLESDLRDSMEKEYKVPISVLARMDLQTKRLIKRDWSISRDQDWDSLTRLIEESIDGGVRAVNLAGVSRNVVVGSAGAVSAAAGTGTGDTGSGNDRNSTGSGKGLAVPAKGKGAGKGPPVPPGKGGKAGKNARSSGSSSSDLSLSDPSATYFFSADDSIELRLANIRNDGNSNGTPNGTSNNSNTKSLLRFEFRPPEREDLGADPGNNAFFFDVQKMGILRAQMKRYARFSAEKFTPSRGAANDSSNPAATSKPVNSNPADTEPLTSETAANNIRDFRTKLTTTGHVYPWKWNETVGLLFPEIVQQTILTPLISIVLDGSENSDGSAPSSSPSGGGASSSASTTEEIRAQVEARQEMEKNIQTSTNSSISTPDTLANAIKDVCASFIALELLSDNGDMGGNTMNVSVQYIVASYHARVKRVVGELGSRAVNSSEANNQSRAFKSTDLQLNSALTLCKRKIARIRQKVPQILSAYTHIDESKYERNFVKNLKNVNASGARDASRGSSGGDNARSSSHNARSSSPDGPKRFPYKYASTPTFFQYTIPHEKRSAMEQRNGGNFLFELPRMGKLRHVLRMNYNREMMWEWDRTFGQLFEQNMQRELLEPMVPLWTGSVGAFQNGDLILRRQQQKVTGATESTNITESKDNAHHSQTALTDSECRKKGLVFEECIDAKFYKNSVATLYALR